MGKRTDLGGVSVDLDLTLGDGNVDGVSDLRDSVNNLFNLYNRQRLHKRMKTGVSPSSHRDESKQVCVCQKTKSRERVVW